MEEIIDEFIFKVPVMEERLEVKEVLCSELEKKSKVCVYYILRIQHVLFLLLFSFEMVKRRD